MRRRWLQSELWSAVWGTACMFSKKVTLLFLAGMLFCAVMPISAFADEDEQAANTVSSSADPQEEAIEVEAENVSNTVNLNQLPDSSFLYDITISDLLNGASFQASQEVQIEGEVVGDLINGDDPTHCWITLQELDEVQPSTVMVYLLRDQANNIDTFGRYGSQGTTMRVRGTFYLTCEAHQGLSDIHATEATVTQKGFPVEVPIESRLLGVGLFMLFFGVALFVYERIVRKQQR